MTRADLLSLLSALEDDAVLAARFARALAPHVAAAFISTAKTGGRTYSTRAGGAPEGYSRDGWRALAHAIGVRRGRYWFVTAEALAAHERARDDAPAAPRSTWTPAAMAADMGLRPLRRVK